MSLYPIVQGAIDQFCLLTGQRLQPKWDICGGFISDNNNYPPLNLTSNTRPYAKFARDVQTLNPVSTAYRVTGAKWFDDGGSRWLSYTTGSPNTQNFTMSARLRIINGDGPICRSDSSNDPLTLGNTIPLWRNSGFDMRVNGTDYSSAGTWNLSQWYDVEIVSTAAGCLLYVDGALIINGSAAGSASLEPWMTIGDTTGTYGSGDVEWIYFVLANRAWTPSERKSFRSNPFQVFEDPFSSFFYTGAGGGASGTLAVTLADTTLAASGTQTIVGSLAQTLANATSTAAGTTTVLGTLAETLDDTTLAASGSIGSPVSGDVIKTLDDVTLSALGTTTVIGTLTQTLGTVVLTADGTTTIVGTIVNTLNNVSLSASGSVGSAVSGSLSITLADTTLNSTGTTTVLGAINSLLADTGITATGTTVVVSTLSQTLSNTTLAATGFIGTPPTVTQWRTLTNVGP